MAFRSIIHIFITISSILIFLFGCRSTLPNNAELKRRDTSSPEGVERITGVTKTLTSKAPLGPITEEVILEAKKRYEILYDQVKKESDLFEEQILRQEATLAKMNYYDLLPIPYRDKVPQTGRGVSTVVLDGGILPETVVHLGYKFIGYYEMDSDFNIVKKSNPQLHPMRFPKLIGSHLIETVYSHGDDMVRFINQIAPDAKIMCVNNYNKEQKLNIRGLEYKRQIYEAPLSITKGLEYLLDNAKLSKPLIVSISEGINPYRKIKEELISEMKKAFKRAYDYGIIVVMAAGNIENHSKDSYKLGMNLGLDCPWIIPVGAVNHKNRALRSARYDPTGRFKVLYAPACSSSVATAKMSGLVSLLLEKNPSLTPSQIRNILFDTADYHEEENNRKVYIINTARAINSIN